MTSTLTPLERTLGDLDSPQYDDERLRLKAYEVYTVAFQATHLLVALVLLIMAWTTHGRTAAWGAGIFGVLYVTLLYTGIRIKQQMDPSSWRMHLNTRMVLALLIYLGVIAGFACNLATGDFARGMLPGLFGGTGTVLLFGWWKSRQTARKNADPARIPDED